MPIPYRDHTHFPDAALLAYLRIVTEPGGKGLRGALFLVNVRGDPVEFCFNRVDLPKTRLWRAGEARRTSIVSLARGLFDACMRTPAVLLARADDVPPLVLRTDLEVLVPACRVSDSDATVTEASETVERFGDAAHLFWVGAPPGDDSPARQALEALGGRGLLLEPFTRAERGLEEAFDRA
jgi:hypothetical protein